MKQNKVKNIRLPDHVKPERYILILKPDLEKFTFTGEETIILDIQKPTKEIILHADELEIEDSVELLSKKISLKPKIKLDSKQEIVTFIFPQTIDKGRYELKIKFTGTLNDKLRGFYRSKYLSNGKDKYLAATQFESTDARRAFPCIDEPAVKAIFDVTLIAPKGTVAISNTLEESIEIDDEGNGLYKFAQSPKMSTYLLAFLIGDFEHIEGKTKRGVRVRVFVTPGKKKEAEFALDTGIKSLEFYENYFAIHYPLPVLDMIAVPDFASGAMENWGAITYRETALLIDDVKSSTANKQWAALVIAHEIAHMWFGDLVTMEWWTDLWLNEGFASYMEFLAIDSIYPEWDLWTQFVSDEHGSALSLDALKNTHPIQIEVHHPSEISEIFDTVSYSKGASVIRMIAEYIGYKDFRDGLRIYLKKHQYSNAKTEDLWLAFEQSSGKPIKKIMKNWTMASGYPLVSIKDEGTKLSLSQERFFSNPTSRKSVKDQTVWSIPLNTYYSGQKNTTQDLMDKSIFKITKPKNDEWMKLNFNESSLIRIFYPAVYLNLLKDPIQNKELGSVDRLGVLRDVFDLSRAGYSNVSEALGLVESYREEDNYTVWAELDGQIDKIERLIADKPFYPKFKNFCLSLFTKIARDMGWEKRKGEMHTDFLLRNLVLHEAGHFGDKEIIKKAKDLFAEVLKGKKIDPDLRGIIFNIVAENGGEKEYKIFTSMYKGETNQQERSRISGALANFSQKALLQKTLEFAFSKDVRGQDGAIVFCRVAVNPLGSLLAFEYLKKNWKEIKEKYSGGGHLMQRMVEYLTNLKTKKDYKDFQTFFKKNPVPEANRTILQVLEKIESNYTWLEKNSKDIEKFLQSY